MPMTTFYQRQRAAQARHRAFVDGAWLIAILLGILVLYGFSIELGAL